MIFSAVEEVQHYQEKKLLIKLHILRLGITFVYQRPTWCVAMFVPWLYEPLRQPATKGKYCCPSWNTANTGIIALVLVSTNMVFPSIYFTLLVIPFTTCLSLHLKTKQCHMRMVAMLLYILIYRYIWIKHVYNYMNTWWR